MQSVDSAEISVAMNSPFWRIRLPEPLEREFEAGTVVTRYRVLAAWLAFPFAYDFFYLVIDVMKGNASSAIGSIHVGVAVLLGTAVIALLAKPPLWLASALIVSAHIADVVSSTYTGLLIPIPFADRVITNAGFTMLIVNVTSPLRFRDAVIFSAGSTIAYGWLLLGPLDHLPMMQVDNVVHAAVMAAISLAVLHRRERSSRQSFVLGALDKRRLQEVAAMSETDALTTLPNRRAFDNTLETQWGIAKANGKMLGLLMIDIDHFKQLNDQRGHAAGDICLKSVASLMGSTMRSSSDVIARFGGEEFAVVLSDTNPAAVLEVAERVRQKVEQAAQPHPVCGVVTVSVGAAVIHPSQCAGAPDLLLAAADKALYQAKKSGRNQVAIEEVDFAQQLIG